MAGKLYWQKIKDRRIDMDVTQKEISERFDINLSTLKGIETGRTGIDITNPQMLPKFKAMVEFLGFSLDEVYNANFRESQLIALLNNKGGSGKTSVSGNLGYALSELGYKVLLIDADAQSNLTQSFDLYSNDDLHLGDAIIKEVSLEPYIIKTEYENLDFIKANIVMSTIDMKLFAKDQREGVLNRSLKPIIDKGIYDYILIDTNPTLSILNLNVLNAVDQVIIPVQMNVFGLIGLDTVLDFVEGVKKFNDRLSIRGILINNYDIRKKVTAKSEKTLRESYADKIMKTVIKVDTSMENAQYNGEPVLIYDTNSRIAKEFRELAKEVIGNGR